MITSPRMSTMNRRDWLRSVAYGAATAALTATPLLTGRGNLMAQGSGRARSYRYIHLDVFTDRRLAGNQLLVYMNPEGLDADAMARLTLESNYSEYTFVLPPAAQPGTDFRVWIFGQTGEIAFAGHPTIGTAFALVHAGRIKPPAASIVFGLGLGPTPNRSRVEGNSLAFAWMTAAEANVRQVDDRIRPLLPARSASLPSGYHGRSRAGRTRCRYGRELHHRPASQPQGVDAAVVDPVKLYPLRTASGLKGFS